MDDTTPDDTPAPLCQDPGHELMAQAVRDMALSVRDAAEELGRVRAHLAAVTANERARAEDSARHARDLIDAGDYSAAAAECHRAHQYRLRADALQVASTVTR